MANIEKELEEYFGTVDLYAILKISKTASQSEIRKAYYRLSVQTHPDKVPSDEAAEATKKFQTLSKLYYILSDQSRRALYDESGSLSCGDGESGLNWMDYWRKVFPTISIQDIEGFEKSYKGSEEEKNDLIKAYEKGEGDMDVITSCMLCCSILQDEQRYRDMLEGMIKEDIVKEFPAFSQEAPKKKKARMAKAEKEKKEFEKEMKKKKEDGVDESLTAILNKSKMKRAEANGKMIEDMEKKYAGKASKKNGKTSEDEEAVVGKKKDAKKGDGEVVKGDGGKGGKKGGKAVKEDAVVENGTAAKGEAVAAKTGKKNSLKGLETEKEEDDKKEEEKDVKGKRKVNGAKKVVETGKEEEEEEEEEENEEEEDDKEEEEKDVKGKRKDKKTEVKGKVEKKNGEVAEVKGKVEKKNGEEAEAGKKGDKVAKGKKTTKGKEEEVDGEKSNKKRKGVKETSNGDVKKAKKASKVAADVNAVGNRTRSKV